MEEKCKAASLAQMEKRIICKAPAHLASQYEKSNKELAIKSKTSRYGFNKKKIKNKVKLQLPTSSTTDVTPKEII